MNLKLISDVIHDNLDIVKPPTALQHTTVSLAPGSVSSIHQAFTAHWPSLISSCTFRLVSVASVSTGLFKPDYKMKPGRSISWIADRSSSVKKNTISDWECMEHTLTWISLRNRPIANLSLCVPPSLPPPVSPLSSSIPTPPPHSSTYRTRRWIWNRCIVVWTVFWTRTWPTSRSPAPLSRSLRWTSAACSPARPLWSRARSPGGTTRPRASLWPPSSPGRGDHLLLFPILTMGGP